jgi:hypothetical protein
MKAEVGIAKFVQDERLENNNGLKGLAVERAVEVAFSKAIAKLGSEGWEMIDAPGRRIRPFLHESARQPSC